MVLDAGGLHKLDRYADLTKPTVFMLSHHHLDHLIGFHPLARFRFKNKVTVVGIIGTHEHPALNCCGTPTPCPWGCSLQHRDDGGQGRRARKAFHIP